jgi:hypothetical protein
LCRRRFLLRPPVEEVEAAAEDGEQDQSERESFP